MLAAGQLISFGTNNNRDVNYVVETKTSLNCYDKFK